MTTDEVFKSRKFKLMMAALNRVDNNILCFRPMPFSDVNLCVNLSAYSHYSPISEINTFVYVKNRQYEFITFKTLGIDPMTLVHNPLKDGGVDPFDYGRIFDGLLSMNTWIGTKSGKTLLVGDGSDLCRLEIELDLYDDGKD